MSTVSASSLRFSPFFSDQLNGITPTAKAAFVSFPSPRTSRLRIACSAKPETVEKVCGIVRKQLALSDETALTPASKFSELGADSLDTVEIVMGLEEEFGISVEEENSQNITTIQEAADLIDKLLQVTPSA